MSLELRLLVLAVVIVGVGAWTLLRRRWERQALDAYKRLQQQRQRVAAAQPTVRFQAKLPKRRAHLRRVK